MSGRRYVSGLLTCLLACSSETAEQPPEDVSRTEAALDASIGGEQEPNDALGDATPLPGRSGRIRATLIAPDNVDTYSFQGSAGDRVYVSTLTDISSRGLDTRIAVVGPSGSVVEADEDDGGKGKTSSAIAGAVLTESGTHYLTVARPPVGVSVRPYDLYYLVVSDPPLAESEPNDSVGQAQVLESGEEVLGENDNVGPDQGDVYAVELEEGDTLFTALDARVGFSDPPALTIYAPDGRFATYGNVSSSTAPWASSAVIRAHMPGLYTFEVAGNTLYTYRIAAAVIPAERGECHTFAGPSGSLPVGAAPAVSTITIPEDADFEVGSLKVAYRITHPTRQQLDVTLRRTDVGEVALMKRQFGTSGTFDMILEASAPFAQSDINQTAASNLGVSMQPEPFGRLEWFEGMRAKGNWVLSVRDNVPATGNGTLDSWSLVLCEPVPEPECPPGTVAEDVYVHDFGSTLGHTQTGSHLWGFTGPSVTTWGECGGPPSCFRSARVPSSKQDLFLPTVDLSRYTGPLVVSWMQAHQLEDATFDQAYVEVIGSGSRRRLWEHTDTAMVTYVGSPLSVMNQSPGWVTKRARIDELAGGTMRMHFHVSTDDMVQLAGVAIDEVRVRGCRIEGCGNGALDDGEDCDDGNTTDGDGCDSNCTTTECGNGILSAPEQCDDGNLEDDDGCVSCALRRCPDGVITSGEECDDGNLVAGDGCDPGCVATACGNGVLTAGETCDDGNVTAGDGCSPTCQPEPRLIEVEPNDDFASATPVPVTRAAIIHGDRYDGEGPDTFGVDLVAGEYLFVAGDALGFAADIHDPSGVQLATVGFSDAEAILAATSARYFVTVRSNGAYRLILHKKPPGLVDENEPNNTDATASVLQPGAVVRGTLHGIDDRSDFYEMELVAGDRLSLMIDHTPPGVDGLHRNYTIWSPEGHSIGWTDMFATTVPLTGTYTMRVWPSSNTEQGTYWISVEKLPAVVERGPCRTYTSSAPVGLPDGVTTTSTVTVPAAEDVEIGDVDVSFRLLHADVTNLTSATIVAPAGNLVELFSSMPTITGSGLDYSLHDLRFDDEAELVYGLANLRDALFAPFERYAVRPKSSQMLAWFDGQRSAGTWTLRIQDGSTCGLGCQKSEGVLLGWALEVCPREEIPPIVCPEGTIYRTTMNATFEQTNDLFTVDSGTDWQRGTPSFAPITNCGGGSRCFKTKLAGNITLDAVQTLRSPFNELSHMVAPKRVRWKQRYEFATRNYHRAWVEATDYTTTKQLWEYRGDGMNANASTGWHQMAARIDELDDAIIKFSVDGSTNSAAAGLAIDDVIVEGCWVPSCHDGYHDPPEPCDDSNLLNGDGCDNNCTLTGCGNGVETAGEECDDGNEEDDDGCDSNCTLTACGNGVVSGSEVCDDGNTIDGDGCDSTCTPSGCGNGIITTPELCDDGDIVDDDGCDSNCTPTGCGNDVLTSAEACDDGNVTNGDGCDSDCSLTGCGNGILTSGEDCDDGNLDDGDGCDAQCAIESTTSSSSSSSAGGGEPGAGGATTTGGGGASSDGGGGSPGAGGSGGDGGNSMGGAPSTTGGAGGEGGAPATSSTTTTGTGAGGGGAPPVTGGGAQGGASAGGSSSGIGGGGGGSDAPEPPPEGEGCSCRVGGQSGSVKSALMAALGLLLGLRTIRRRARRGHAS